MVNGVFSAIFCAMEGLGVILAGLGNCDISPASRSDAGAMYTSSFHHHLAIGAENSC